MSAFLRFAPYAAVLAAICLSHWLAYSRGAANTKAKYELQLQVLHTSSAMAKADLERRIRGAERAGAAALSAESRKHVEEARHAKMEIDALRADLRASRVRLSVPVASCTDADRAAGPDPAAAGGSSAEARAELMPQTADDLVAIAADGDAAVRQLNAVIDAFEVLRERYNSMTSGSE